MKIKRLEILGFKSFVDKVSLDFERGITGVVGPNGCGKSNVVDAIRWVMGEQNARHLRGRMMEDVIFGGSETRKPHGLAQVSITFDNRAGLCPAIYKDFAEIMITRRLYRSGESEYLINSTPCRLLDITELFMDTGVGARAYSIIEQGKVGMLVSAKAEERRLLIEEAAGVTKFKSRKKTAVRKMDATKQNLVRLGDIISEVRRQIGSLKRQAQKAEKFRQYRGEVKQIELSLAGNRFQKLKSEIDIVSQQEKEQAVILERLDARLEEGDLHLEEQQLKLSEVEAEHRQTQEKIYQLGAEVQRVENERKLLISQKELFSTQEEEIQAELKDYAARLDALASEQKQLQVQESASAQGLESLQREVASRETALQDSLDKERQLNTQFEECRSELMELFAQSNRLANRRDEIDRRLIAEAERRKQSQRDAQQIQEQQAELQQRRERIIEQLQHVHLQQDVLKERTEDLSEQLEQLRGLFNSKESALNELKRRLEKNYSVKESLETLQHNLEGYSDGTQLLLREVTGKQRIFADFLKVSSEYEIAVEMVLGEKLQAVPVENLTDVKATLSFLAEQQARASLLVSQNDTEDISYSGGEPLVDLITTETGTKELVRQLFAGVFLVDAVTDHLEKSLPVGTLLVDRRGACFDWRGILTGGATSTSGTGILQRQRRLDEVTLDIETLEQEVASRQREQEQTQEHLQQVEEAQLAATSEAHRLELQALEFAKDRQSVQSEFDYLNKRLALLVFDLEQIDEGQEALQQEKDQLAQGGQETEERQQQLETLSKELQEDMTGLRVTLDTSREGLTGQRVELASLQQQQHALHETLERIKNQQQDLNQRTAQLTQRREAGVASQEQIIEKDQRLQIELDLLLNRRTDQQQDNEIVQRRYEDQRLQLEEFREQLRRVRSEAEELRKVVSRLQLRNHELQVDFEHVRQGVQERYQVDLSEHQVPEATDDELERQQQQLQRLQQRINLLGEVNLMAIDEYNEQEKRYDFLLQQRDDLNQSLDDLQKAINQINRTTRRRFKETFELVNEKFKQVFPRLFIGGQAELRLTDEDDLLETGIDIVAQPPGKRLQSVNLLSGGEKALTAVALIFSLFLIKPTPFCILDEVDAPLDDANIDRFADIVQEMTSQSQFIVITHSKRTMNIVDTLYGVTMQEPGISKLVSVRMNDFQLQEDAALTG
ncbi:chromosome segregation protein SMC [uncultured Desulfuromusa sp.]|uniref:chromosome segregation protein SMC n=1 Tax=uncultured Desulfuromusa sp. TaxID=219183 RepID=UPI002AA8C68A|nr:chromosome segregation protein SMC [uncultured Desulfuromusa sp.]